MRWLAAFALAAACSVGEPGPGLDVDRVLGHVSALTALGPHPGDSDGARHAAEYIDEQLIAFGVTSEHVEVGTVDIPEIRVAGMLWRPTRHRVTSDPDLLVRFGPPGKALLVMAHYDTVPTSPGAVDNAAAVGVLIELARALHDRPPAQPIALAFTANEEIGLVGAQALAERRGGEFAFAIALDLVGGSGPLVINGASTLIGRGELDWLADAASRAGVELSPPPVHRVISRWWPAAERSDHGPFTLHGIRAVHLYNRGQDGERIDLAYHSPGDVASRVQRASVDAIGRLLVALVAVAPPAPGGGDGYWIPYTRLVVPRWMLVAFELGCAVLAIGALIAGRRRAPREPGAGLVVGALCYTAAVALAIGVERLAAGAHPAPWLHAPLVAELAGSAVIVGGFGLLVRLVARRARWTGSRRYLAVATLALVVPGLAWLAVDAAEIAWLWLVPAAAIAVAPRLGRAAPIALATSLLPAVLALAPSQLREAAWNGFLPTAVPLAGWLGWFVAPAVAAWAWWSRGRTWGPLGSLVLSVGCALAVGAGVFVMLVTRAPCSAREFHDFHLACEVRATWP